MTLTTAPQRSWLPSLQCREWAWPLGSSGLPTEQAVLGPSQEPRAPQEGRPDVTRTSHLSKGYDLNSYVRALKVLNVSSYSNMFKTQLFPSWQTSPAPSGCMWLTSSVLGSTADPSRSNSPSWRHRLDSRPLAGRQPWYGRRKTLPSRKSRHEIKVPREKKRHELLAT